MAKVSISLISLASQLPTAEHISQMAQLFWFFAKLLSVIHA